MLSTTPKIKYEELLNLWKRRHEHCLQKAKEKIEIQKIKYKKLQDSKISIPQGVYEPADLVKFINNHPENKLSPSWKGPAVIVEHQENNYTILFNNKRIRIHANQLMPYYK